MVFVSESKRTWIPITEMKELVPTTNARPQWKVAREAPLDVQQQRQ